jgi:hypothetical protein
MNDKMIEATSHLKSLAQASGQDETVRCLARARLAPCESTAVSTACNTLTVATTITW